MSQEKNQMVNDTHIRWSNLSEKKQLIWDRYSNEIVPQIIKAALEKEPLSFKDLYQVLSIARLRCEFEKEDIDKENETYFLASISLLPFGLFQYGGTTEPGITVGWGEQVNKLVKERFKTMSIALSTCIKFKDGTLIHPEGPILERVDKIFQQLIQCDDFFEFLQLAGRINYDLANFPPITRGSAALSSWLFDSLMQIKFGIGTSCRPLLYDWTAFFESPEFYSNFYVLSVLSNYFRTIPELYSKHQQLFDSIPEVMRRDPNDLENLQAREEIWQKMRSYIETELQANSLSLDQRKQLKSILKGNILFRKPSKEFKAFFQLISQYEPSELNMTILNELIKESGYTKQNLCRLLVMHKYTAEVYLGTEYGNGLHADWVDLELLRALDGGGSYINHIDKILMIAEPSLTIPTLKIQELYCELSAQELQKKLLKKPPIFIQRSFNIYFIDKDWNPIKMPSTLDIFRKISLATWEELIPINIEVLYLFANPSAIEDLQTKALARDLQEAVWYGGIKLQDLAGLNIDQVKAITSPAALAAYKENRFNRCTDILFTPRHTNLKENESKKIPMTETLSQREFFEALSIQLDTIFDLFEEKINGIGSQHPNAHDRAKALLEFLRTNKIITLNDPTPEKLSAFKNQAQLAIQREIPELQKDLGWEVYLSNLAKQIVNTVTIFLAKIATFGYSNHHGFFGIEQSDAVSSAKKLAKSIENTHEKKP